MPTTVPTPRAASRPTSGPVTGLGSDSDAAGQSSSGTLFIIGGAEDKIGRRELLQRFVRRTGSGRIAVVPTASSLGVDVVDLYDALFRRLGATEVVAIRPETRAQAQDPLLAKELADFDGVFMTGGNQLKLAAAIVGTAFGDAIREVYAGGGVVGGTSAGASIVSEHMVAFGSGGATPRHRMSQLARGLGLLPDVVVDQHFRERDRYGRLLALIAQSPSLLGIGIDEDTAAIVSDGVMEVAGRGAVTVVDARDAVSSAATAKASQPILVSGAVLHVLPAGACFDVASRSLYVRPTDLPVAERKEIAATELDMRKLARRIAREDASPVRRRVAAAGATPAAEPADEEEAT